MTNTPVSDSMWQTLLVEGAVIPRAVPSELGTWGWCDRCRALMPCRVSWWPNTSTEFGRGGVQIRPAALSAAGATVKEARDVQAP
jgi:hypothetical protein